MGFIGNFDRVLELVSEYLKIKVTFNQIGKEGIVFFKRSNKIAVALKIEEDIYDYKK